MQLKFDSTSNVCHHLGHNNMLWLAAMARCHKASELASGIVLLLQCSNFDFHIITTAPNPVIFRMCFCKGSLHTFWNSLDGVFQEGLTTVTNIVLLSTGGSCRPALHRNIAAEALWWFDNEMITAFLVVLLPRVTCLAAHQTNVRTATLVVQVTRLLGLVL